jgi:hypothetical protein
MVEMCVVAGVLTMLFLGTWYLGKFHDIQASTIQAARFAAWERTARGAEFSDQQLEQQARARLYTWNQDPFKDSDGRANGRDWSTQHAMWLDHTGERLINRPDDVAVSTSSAALPGHVGAKIEDVIGGIEAVTGRLTGGEMLPRGGFYTSKVSVKLSNVAALPAPLNALNLSLTESSAVVGNAWDASGPEQVALRTKPWVPASALGRAAGLLQPVIWALSFLEPSFDRLTIGKICPEIVPGDRVSNGRVLAAYRGASCY